MSLFIPKILLAFYFHNISYNYFDQNHNNAITKTITIRNTPSQILPIRKPVKMPSSLQLRQLQTSMLQALDEFVEVLQGAALIVVGFNGTQPTYDQFLTLHFL